MSTLATALQARPEPPVVDPAGRPCKIVVNDLNFHYGAKQALENAFKSLSAEEAVTLQGQ